MSAMKFPRLLLCALCLPLALAHAADAPPVEKKKAGPLEWLRRHVPLPKFGGKKDAGGTWKQLDLTMNVLPPNPKLSETKQLKVTLQLVNKGRKMAQLEFPTSQRIEVLVKNAAGKTIEQWSEDQAFTNDPTVETINPGERLEYSASIATRDLAAGQSYTIEAFFPNYEPLRTSKTLVPEK